MEKVTELERKQYDKYGELVQACKELPKVEAKAKIDLLLAEGIIPHNLKWTENNDDTSCVEEIVRNFNLSEDEKIAWLNQLVARGADLHVATYNGTLLHTAMINGCQKLAALLLEEKGLDVNGRHSLNLNTALHQQAIFTGQQIISHIKFLLVHGANPLLKNKFNKTPRDIAESDEIRQLLQIAEEQQRLKENQSAENTLRQRRPVIISSDVQAHGPSESANTKKTESKSASSKLANLLACVGGLFFTKSTTVKNGYQRLSSETSLAPNSPSKPKISS